MQIPHVSKDKTRGSHTSSQHRNSYVRGTDGMVTEVALAGHLARRAGAVAGAAMPRLGDSIPAATSTSIRCSCYWDLTTKHETEGSHGPRPAAGIHLRLPFRVSW